MKIDILTNDGSPLGVHYSDIFGKNGRIGLGGAELALMTMAEAWTNCGHEVVLYNNPIHQKQSPFEQRQINSFEKEAKRDVLVVFRSPNQRAFKANGLKVWWSCDQYSTGDYAHFSQFANKIVTISPHHSEYFEKTYGIRNTITIDIPVRAWEYEEKIEKVPNRLIFTSVPDRGLEIVAKTFSRIRDIIPDISLVVTSDYRLWGTSSPLNDRYIQMFLRERNVELLGAVPRERLIQEQLKAQIHYYPAIYNELFCIAVAESQVAGVLPITTPIGALETTNMGVIINGDARDSVTQQAFVNKTVEYLHNRNLASIQKELQEKAKERFSLERILKIWDREVFNA